MTTARAIVKAGRLKVQRENSAEVVVAQVANSIAADWY